MGSTLALEPAARWDVEALTALEFPILEYEVSREKILEYAVAIGDLNAIHRDAAAARTVGYRDVVAPPTFAAVFLTTPIRRAVADPEWALRAGFDSTRILHGEQTLDFARPIHPGDRLIVQAIVTDAYERKGMAFVIVGTRVDTERGERVLEGRSTLVVRP